MKLLAFAILCSRGEVHECGDHCFLFLDEDQAKDAIDDLVVFDEPCGPHRVVTLQTEEVR